MFRIAALLIVLAVASSSHAQQTPTLGTAVQPLLKTYCLDCHGPDEQKANVRFDTLKPDFADQKILAQWIKIHDKLVAGEMPPKDSARPPEREMDAAIKCLRQELHAASLRRQQTDGRVVVRRLNGTEYENTIRDLLGVNVNLKELLPDDNAMAGFDNVGDVLEVSATHQLLYQEAAERAIVAAIPIHPTLPFSNKRTTKEMIEKGPNFQQTLTRSCRRDGDSLIIHSKLPRYGLCSSAPVPTAGRYRVQISIGAVGENVASVPAAFLTVEQSGREDAVVKEFRDIPVGPPHIVELEFDLKRRQSFVVNMLSVWDIRNFKKPIEEYTGPGLILDWINVEGPLDPFPPASYQRLFGDVPLKARSVVRAVAEGKKPSPIPENRTESNWTFDPLVPASDHPKEDAERLIRDFLPRAFRRPVSEDLQRHFVARVHAKLDEKYPFMEAMIYGYKAILTSPHFLLMVETTNGQAAGEATAANAPPLGKLPSTALDDYALAGRLSYFLWSTAPDEELLALAAKNELHNPAVLRAQVERLLNAPHANRFTDNFTGQWLELRKIADTIPDPHLYNDFDGVLLWAMPLETRLFFKEVLQKDLSVLEFIDSDWTFLNERLATHYGIPGISGNELRKVNLPPASHRGGVMTQASVLKVTADGTRTSPVLRGKWVLDKMLGTPPAPPPPDVPAIEPDIRGATTIREQLDKHRNVAACATCHVHIDPPGFALENFDPIGGWRTFYRATTRTKAGIVNLPNFSGRPIYRGPDVEMGGQTHDGQSFRDIDEYKKILLVNKDQIARNLTQKLLVYATGADIQFADREVVEQIVAKLRPKNYPFRTLLHEVVQSRLFLLK